MKQPLQEFPGGESHDRKQQNINRSTARIIPGGVTPIVRQMSGTAFNGDV
jgi:hypothetical protein